MPCPEPDTRKLWRVENRLPVGAFLSAPFRAQCVRTQSATTAKPAPPRRRPGCFRMPLGAMADCAATVLCFAGVFSRACSQHAWPALREPIPAPTSHDTTPDTRKLLPLSLMPTPTSAPARRPLWTSRARPLKSTAGCGSSIQPERLAELLRRMGREMGHGLRRCMASLAHRPRSRPEARPSTSARPQHSGPARERGRSPSDGSARGPGTCRESMGQRGHCKF